MASLNKFLSLLFLGLLSVSEGLMLFFFITPLKKGEADEVFVVFCSVPLPVMILSFKYPEKFVVVLQYTVDHKLSTTCLILTTTHHNDITLFFISVLLYYVFCCSLYLGSDQIMFAVLCRLSLQLSPRAVYFFCDKKMVEGCFMLFELVVALISYVAGRYGFCPLVKAEI